jgi:hypothetical protein
MGRLRHHIVSFIVIVMEREVTAWFRQQPKEFYAAGFQGLVKRWDKCLNVQGDYVIKVFLKSVLLFKFHIHLKLTY